jgi:hypothetical protein
VRGEGDVSGNLVVMGVSLLTWAATFFYLLRLERRIKDLEKS